MHKNKLTAYFIALAILLLLQGCASTLNKSPLLQSPQPVPTGHISAQFFGASTILISDGETSLMIDGFFSRSNYFKGLFTGVKPDEAKINFAQNAGNFSKLDAILVAHSHIDHLLDAPTLAKKTSAELIGSETSIQIALNKTNICKDKTNVINPSKTINKGSFEIGFYPTPHVPKNALLEVLERITLIASRGLDYKNPGQNYSFFLKHPRKKILIIPSANFKIDNFSKIEVDVVFLSIGLLGNQSPEFIESYWKESVIKTKAKLVIPIHWDNLYRPLKYPLKASPKIADDIEHAMRLLRKFSERDRVSIGFLPTFEKVDLEASYDDLN